eukprot:Gb_11179 [translate_table: standard]
MEMDKNSKWGTWEELLLGSAVKKHGINNWDSVSLEVQARKLSPYFFSSEDCKAKYDALQGRYNKTHNSNNNSCRWVQRYDEFEEFLVDDCSNSLPWLEELRKLRVAQLKRELERYDGSIVSLESKLRKLKAERAQCLLNDEQKTAEKCPPQREIKRDPEDVPNSLKEGSKDGSCTVCIYPETTSNVLGREGLCPENTKVDKIEGFDNPNRPLNPPDPAEPSRSGNNRVETTQDLGSKDPLGVHEGSQERNRQGTQDLPLERLQPALVHPQVERFAPQENGLPDEKKLDEPRDNKPKPDTGPSSPLDSYYGSSETIAKEHPDPLGYEEDAREQDFVESADVLSESSRPKHEETIAPTAMKGHGFQEGSAESREIGQDEERDKEICEKSEDRRDGLQTWDTSDVLSSAELSTRRRDGRKSSSTSHEASEYARGHYKDCEDSMGGWQHQQQRHHHHHQATRSSGDSHAEGTDEMSPMSKRSRREAKVPGKLLPLLECLRAISAHKFGSIFKHRLESQENLYYTSMIRRHVDLGMVRSRLEEGSYSGSLEFFRDLLLVFNNALVYYPKYSQEFGAAYVLRELATKEMANIFQTEALLKQEGPSTRKREPRKPSELAMVAKPNPNPIIVCRKRNASTSVGEKLAGRPKSARMSLEQSSAGAIQMLQQQQHLQAEGEKQSEHLQVEDKKQNEKKDVEIKENGIEKRKNEELKDLIKASTSVFVSPNPEVQPEPKTESIKGRSMDNSLAENVCEQNKPDKLAEESKHKSRDTENDDELIKTSYKYNTQPKKNVSNNTIDLKRGSSSNIDQKKSSSDILVPKKSSSNVVESIKRSMNIIETKKSPSNMADPIKSSNNIVTQKRSSGNILKGNRDVNVKKEQIVNPSLKHPPKQALAPIGAPIAPQVQPPVKRGVGRPPKHAKQASQKQHVQQSVQKQQASPPKTMDSKLLSKPRKRARR